MTRKKDKMLLGTVLIWLRVSPARKKELSRFKKLYSSVDLNVNVTDEVLRLGMKAFHMAHSKEVKEMLAEQDFSALEHTVG